MIEFASTGVVHHVRDVHYEWDEHLLHLQMCAKMMDGSLKNSNFSNNFFAPHQSLHLQYTTLSSVAHTHDVAC